MIPLTAYKDQTIGVFGLAKSGEATVAALLAGGAKVYAWDDSEARVGMCREVNPKANYASFDRWPWQEIDTVVLSPGVPLTHPKPHLAVVMATMRRARIIGEIELLQEQCPEATYVGITGTNGKSTTTALVDHILHSAGRKVQVGGNLGTPALALEPLGADGVYVLEMSSYQIDLLSSTIFNIAALLNISPDHLDRHGGMEGYVTAKRGIFNGQGAKNTAIISVDDKESKKIYDEMKSGKHRYAWQGKGAELIAVSMKRELKGGVYAKDAVLYDGADGPRISISNVPTLKGEHNWQNAAFAGAICKALGLNKQQIEDGMRSFQGLPHRMEIVNTGQLLLCVNDSKATNADAAAKSLAAYENIYWIAGGVAKEGGIDSLEPYLSKIRRAYLIGQAANEFKTFLESHGVDCHLSISLQRATEQAIADAREKAEYEGVVLLAPACASFDQFHSFEDRGNKFKEYVADAMKVSPEEGHANSARTA